MSIRVFRVLAGVLLVAAALLASPKAQQINPYPSGPPFHDPPSDTYKFRDLRVELKNKMTGTFTVASVGDMFWRSPVGERMSPPLRDLLRNADLTVGNFEGGEGWQPRDTAKTLQSLGFDLLAPGEGVQAHELLAEFGIKMAGSGPNLTMARRPVFHELPQGRVSLVAACPGVNLCGNRATNAGGGVGGGSATPGVNPLGVTVWNTVTAEQFNHLKAILDSVVARRTEADVVVPTDLPPPLPAGRLMLWGQRYMVAAKPGELHYDLDPADEQAQILAVRNAKEVADFAIFHMHVHHNRYSFQQYSHDNYPVNYMRPLLHKLIDNGLDMYFGSGNHSMQGIEIYKGRPIFYNQGNVGVDLVRSPDSPPNSANITGTESREQSYLQDEPTSVAYMANTTYKDGRLVEVRIYPVDVGIGRKAWSRENVPETPSPELARSILERIQKYSEPFGTKISIENNIGIIRVSPEATVDVGGDLVIQGRKPQPQGN